MKTDDEILELIEKYLADGFEELWDALLPEERGSISRLVAEYVSSTY